MKLAAGLLFLSVLLLPVAAEEGPKVALAVVDRPLAEVARALGQMSSAKVLVASALERKPVTLEVKSVPVEKALAALAEAAETKVERLGRTVWWIGPPRVDREAEDRKTLESTRMSLNLRDVPLPKALALVASFTGVGIQVDPEVLRARKPEELSVNLAISEIQASQLLDLVTELMGLAWDVRWGGVLVSTKDRLRALPRSTLAAPGGEIPEAETVLRAKLARDPVSFDFAETPASRALDFLRSLRGIGITTDEKAKADLDAATLTLRVRETALQDALDQILLPRGFTWSLTETGVTVKR